MIFDCDRHVIEPLAMWEEYTEKSILKNHPIRLESDNIEKQLKRVLTHRINVSLPPTFSIGDYPILSNWGDVIQIASALLKEERQQDIKRAVSPAGQLEAMDASSVHWAQILPTFTSYIVNHNKLSTEGSLGYAKAYNRWLSDYCAHNTDRLLGVGIVSRHDSKRLKSQVEDIVNRGWSAITIRPEPILGKSLGHPDYESFWQACEYHRISVVFHGGTHLQGATVGMDRFTNRFSLHACSHPMEAQMAFVTLLEAGVFERHPKLKFAFLEAGASWVPHWLWRLDNICYPEFPTLIKDNIKMPPSEYFKRQCWVAVEIGEPCLRQVVNSIGCEKLLYGSDYPHPDHSHLVNSDIAKQLPDLTATERHCMLEDNGKVFYGLIEGNSTKPTSQILKKANI